MSLTFPQTRSFTGFNAPGRFECDLHDLEVVQGEVPVELEGSFFRVGPDPQFPPKNGDDIPLNGDGMACAFRFSKGRVSLSTRYIRTPKFVAEREAGQALFGVYRNPYTDDPSVAGLSRGTANTNLVWHAGRLLALKEDSQPIEIDPHTLETLGTWDFHGALKSPTCTAHPKIDPVTGEMIFYGYEAKGEATPDIAYYVADRHGRITQEHWFQAPYASMVHDFGVTQEHVVFAISPLVANLDLMRQGGPHFGWDGQRDVHVGIFPRATGPRDIRWFRAPTCFSSHVLNAFTDGSKVHFDTPAGEMVVFPFFPLLSGGPFDQAKATPYIERWSFDLAQPGEGFERRRLSDIPGEFPRVDDRFAGGNVRHAWMVARDTTRERPATNASISGKTFDALAHLDLAQQRTHLYYVGDNASTQEPIFAPRPGSSTEGDGYVMALVNRLGEMRNDLVILDAQAFDKGPVATLRLPLRLRNGLHGNWVARADLP